MPHRCCDNYNNVFDILEKTPNLTVSAEVHEDTECLDGPEMRVQGSVVSFLERLDDELTKSLQIIDPHTTEYVTRLRDEMVFIRVAYRCHAFAARMGEVEELCRAKMRLVDHMYYKVRIIWPLHLAFLSFVQCSIHSCEGRSTVARRGDLLVLTTYFFHVF